MTRCIDEKRNIALAGGVNRQFDLYLLDLYALSVYKRRYDEVRISVNKDIRDLVKRYNTVEVKAIRALLTCAVVPVWGEMVKAECFEDRKA